MTLLFLDFTGTWQEWFGWMAKMQFLPALLAVNVGVIILLIGLTLLLGRVYCSIICPLGIMQDGFGWIGKRFKRNRYGFSTAKNLLRYVMLAVMILSFGLGISSVVALLAPYSAYGRIAQTILSPIWQSVNNLLSIWSENNDNFYFYNVEIWLRSPITIGVAAVTLIVLGFLSFRNGRTYCNTICPVGTVLSFFARYSLFRPIIDRSKCNSCGLCSRNCKSACIDSKNHTIDYSRCVTCFDCINKCNKGAISYTFRHRRCDEPSETTPSGSRRQFLSVSALFLTSAALHAQEKTVDGGLAAIEEKKIPNRKRKIIPPGAKSIANLSRHCTACQLCVSACPNGVLRPSSDSTNFMQPESSYERGYCRPECTRCSNVCPTGAIIPISRADKSSVQIGHAVWIKENCIPLTDGVSCGNCERHCPTGAITMISSDPDNEEALKIPAVNTEKCIGCGACENLCPARPFSAIYVEGHEKHRII